MRALLERAKQHKKPIAAVGAAGGGAFVFAGVGLALAAGAAVAGIYFLERARKTREKLL